MKKNLFLGFIFLSLLTLAYYSEEVQKPRSEVERVSKGHFFHFSPPVRNISLENITLVLKNEKWVIAKDMELVDQGIVRGFLKILSGISRYGKLAKDQEKFAFSETNMKFTIKTSRKTYSLTLGNVSKTTGRFYLKEGNTTYIVKDDSLFDGVYASDLDLALKKYLRLKNYIALTREILLERRLLISHLDKKLLAFKIEGGRNRWFSIDLKNKIMIPKPPVGIYLKPLESTAKDLLGRIRLKRKHPKVLKKSLAHFVSKIELIFENKALKMSFFKSLAGNYGHFISFDDEDIIFEIEELGAEAFFTPYQYFWRKGFVHDPKIFQVDSFDFELSRDQTNFFKFQVADVKTFHFQKISSEVKSISRNYLNFLFNLILNTTKNFREASYLNENITFQEFRANSKLLSLKLFSKVFHIKILKDQILVLDEKAKISYVFPVENAQVSSEELQRIFTLGHE